MTNTIHEVATWTSTYIPLISTIVVSIATVVLVVLTSKYVKLTCSLVEETRRSREPSVTMDFEIPDHSLRLVFTNHGQSPAKNIRITVLKDVTWIEGGSGSRGFAELNPVKNGISYLTPSRTLKYYIGYPSWKDTPDEQMEAIFSLKYENENGNSFEHTVDFDFEQMRDVLFESFRDPNQDVAKAIRDAERNRQSHESRSSAFRHFGIHATKKCPMCAETIPLAAKKCSHCQSNI